MNDFSLIDRIVCAAAQAWNEDGEVLATGIGVVPRLAASLCMASANPDLMMTDSEAWLVSEPVPLGPRGDYQLQRETWMGFSRIFDNVWSGKRHAMVGPTQVEHFGQANIYWYASDQNKPPIGDMKMRWPGRAPYAGTFHDLCPSWAEFWASRPDKDALPEVAAPAPLEQFLETMRRGTPAPRIRVR